MKTDRNGLPLPANPINEAVGLRRRLALARTDPFYRVNPFNPLLIAFDLPFMHGSPEGLRNRSLLSYRFVIR